MHLFFDTVWKLHIGEIPARPDAATASIRSQMDYAAAIAAIKQNALTVGNPELIEKIIPVPIGMSYKKDHFYPLPNGWDNVEILEKNPPVAILTLPEEKKNTMENITTSICPKCGNDLSNLDRLHFGMCSKCFAYDCTKSDSGSVAAPKEEGEWSFEKDPYGNLWQFYQNKDFKFKALIRLPQTLCDQLNELASLRQQLKEREEALKELLPMAQWGYDLLVPFDKKGMGREWPAIIERARKTLNT